MKAMSTQILLGKILKRFKDLRIAQVRGYTTFEYLKETPAAVYVLRQKGTKARVPFKKMTLGIDAFKAEPSLYDEGPTALRKYGITHVTSPVWTLLHLLEKGEYLK